MLIRQLFSFTALFVGFSYIHSVSAAGCVYTAPGGTWEGCTGGNYIHRTTACPSGSDCTSDIDDTTTEGLLYSCSSTTSCSEVDGKGYYIKSGTEAYFCNGKGKCKKLAALGAACDATSIGKLYDPSAVKICLSYDGTTAINHALSAASSIIIPHYTGSVFGTTISSQYALLIVDANKSILKGDANNNGYYYVKSADLTIEEGSTALDSDKGFLINCSSGICTKVMNAETGYYKTKNTKYVSCNASGCKYLALDSNCKIGQMKTTADVCLDADQSGTPNVATFVNGSGTKKYLLYYDVQSLFASSIRGGQYGVLKATQTEITLDTTVNGEVCVDTDDLTIVADCTDKTKYTCASGVCTLNNALPACTEASGTGCNGVTETTSCLNSSSKKLYLSTKSESCADQSTSLTASSYLVFKCTNKDICTQLDANGIDGLKGTESLLVYYVDANKVLNQKKDGFFYLESEKNKLIYCPGNSGICYRILTKGHYVNSGTNSNESDATANPLLTINGSDEAEVVAKASVKTGTYYIDASSEVESDNFTKLIHCVDNQGTIVCTSITPTEGYYLNDAKSGLTNAIITCAGTPLKCKTGTGTNDFSYIDAGKDGNIISCAGSACTTAPGSKLQGHAYRDGTESTTPNIMITYDRSKGKFVSTSLTLSATAIYYISAVNPGVPIQCNTSGCVVGSLTDAFYEDATDPNYVITCRDSEGCLSSKSLTRCASVTSSSKCKYKDGLADTDLVAGRYCLYTDKKIYKSGDSSCQDQPVGTYLFKANGNFYDAITLDTSYTGNDSGLIYECTTGVVCKQVISSSVVVSDKYMYTCDKDGLCTKTTTIKSGHYLLGGASVVSNKSYLTHSKLLKCEGNSLDVCEVIDLTANGATANDNHIDAANLENIITCPTTTSCYSSAHGGTAYESKYYVDADNKKNIITCNNAGCISSPGSLLPGHAYISGTDPEKKTLITYDNSDNDPAKHKFKVGSAIDADKYFIDGTNPKNLISCTVSGGCFVSAPPIPSGSTMLFKTDGITDENTITCTSEGCISSKAMFQCFKIENSICYKDSRNKLGQDKYCIHTDGKIYKVSDGNGTCTAQSDSTYILKITSGPPNEYTLEDIDTNEGVIYTCESGICSQIIQSNYVDEDTLYICDKDGTCKKATSIALGYYLLGPPSISQTAPFHTYKKLLKCSGNNLDNCKELDSIPNGHFIDASIATPKNVITCVKSKFCSIQTGTTDSGYAYIDGSDLSTLSLIVYDSDDSELKSILGSKVEGHAYIDAGDVSSKSIIICSQYGCVSEDKIKNLTAEKKIYFINGYLPNSEFISCEKNRGKCIVNTMADATLNGLYPDGTDSTNARSILCINDTGCISSKSITQCSSTEAACKYDNAGTATDLALNHFCFWKDASNNMKIYKAATASTCTYEEGTFLIKSDGTGMILDDTYTGSDSGLIFECKTDVCVPLISTAFLGPAVAAADNKPTYLYQCDGNGQCSKVSAVKEGIYVNGKPTIVEKKPLTYTSLVKCTSNAVADCSEVASLESLKYFVDVEKTLIECSSGSCQRVETPSLGFYKNDGDTTTNKYIQCIYGKCEAIPEPNIDCSSNNHIGQLIKDGSDIKVCLDEGKKSGTFGAGTGPYLVKYYTSSVFKYYVNSNDFYGLISVLNANYLILDNTNAVSIHCFGDGNLTTTAVQDGETCNAGSSKFACNTDGVCVKCTTGEKCVAPDVKVREIATKVVEEDTSATSIRIECKVLTGENCENTYYLVNKEENYSLSEEEGALFYCDPENQKQACTEIFDVGYYIIDKETIYSCKAGSNGLDCTHSELTDQDNDCVAATIGKLFLNQNKLALCLDYDTTAYSIDLTPITSGNYLIKKDSSNIFGIPNDRDYAIVNVKEKIITINLNYDNKLKYVYANKDTKMKLLEKGDTCPKNGNVFDESKILELDCINSRCKTLS